MTDALWCEPVTFVARSVDGGRSTEFEPDQWEVEYLRNRIAAITVDADTCSRIDRYDPWCDYVEVYVGGCLAARRLFQTPTPDVTNGLGVTATSRVALLNKRRWPATVSLTGTSGQLWGQVWDTANGVGATGLTPQVRALGFDSLTIAYDQGDTMGDAINDLSPIVTWSEHGGNLYDWNTGDEPTGRTLTADWWIDYSCGGVGAWNTDALVNDIEIAYRSDLSATVRYPPEGAPTTGPCVLQAPRIDQPLVNDEATALALARAWYDRLSVAAPVIRSAQLDPVATGVHDIVPGVWHLDNTSPHAGRRFNLDGAVVSGVRNCTTSIVADYDQGDSQIRGLVASG